MTYHAALRALRFSSESIFSLLSRFDIMNYAGRKSHSSKGGDMHQVL
nr:MAG TPA: hypothetical protein [Caudoviricetes sp.]